MHKNHVFKKCRLTYFVSTVIPVSANGLGTVLGIRYVNFREFISQYEISKSRDSSSTRKLTRHSDVDDALNA